MSEMQYNKKKREEEWKCMPRLVASAEQYDRDISNF